MITAKDVSFFMLCLAVVITILILVIPAEMDPEWEKAKRSNSIDAIERFVKKYQNSSYLEDANEQLEALYFKQLTKYSTIKSLSAFLENFPKSELIPEVRNILEAKYFIEADEMPSVHIYNEFLRLFPESTKINKAKIIIEELQLQRKEELRNLKRIHLTISVGLPHNASLPVDQDTVKLIGFAGLVPVTDPEAEAELLLRITGIGEPLQMTYEGRGIQYTGARLEGKIEFILNGVLLLSRDFDGYENCLRSVGKDDYSDPSDAPFEYAYVMSEFPVHMLESFEILFGENIINASLQLDNSHLQDAAGTILLAKIREGDLNASRQLATALHYSGKDFALYILRELQSFAQDSAVLPLIGALRNIDDTVRSDAISLLKPFRSPLAVKPLLEMLKDDSFLLRALAVNTLAEINDNNIGDSLLKILNDPHAYPRMSAAQALGKIGYLKSVPLLINLLKDNNQQVRDAAHTSLKTMTGESIELNYKLWRKWFKSNGHSLS